MRQSNRTLVSWLDQVYRTWNAINIKRPKPRNYRSTFCILKDYLFTLSVKNFADNTPKNVLFCCSLRKKTKQKKQALPEKQKQPEVFF